MRRFSSEKMKEILDDPRWKLSGIARVSGLSPNALTKLKDGSIPNANTLAAVADAVGIPIDQFYEDDITIKKKAG